jgi:1-acyl-sn-glycerol-3-phosphate acyltransferase
VRLYTVIAFLLRPTAWWGRLEVVGLERVPAAGPVLVVPNHDSQMDPVIVGIALQRRRQLRYLARANLWKIRGLGPVLSGMGQIPIERGSGDRGALTNAEEVLRSGEAVCIFPEGKLSLGRRLRARSGVSWLARACPNVRVVLCAVSGTTDYVRFPRRPRVRVEVFEPAGGQPRPDEEPGELAERLLAEIRDRVPPVAAGRRPEPAPVGEAG